MEENTSKKLVAADSNLAAGTLMNASGTGSSLFVINLCASMAPVANVGKCLPGLDAYRLYQVARREDGRTRYRLRLGFFTSEADANAVLDRVRGSYPTAFTTCLCEEDRKFVRGFEPVARPAVPKIAVVENKSAAKPVAAAPATIAATRPAIPAVKPGATTPKPAIAPKAAQPTKTPAPVKATPAPAAARPTVQPKAAPPKQTIEAPSKLRATIELSLASEAPPVPRPAAAAPSNEPFRVSKGVDIPATSLTLEATGAIPAPAIARKSAPAAPPKPAAAQKPAATPPARVATAPAQPVAPAMTMRATQAAAPAAAKPAARDPLDHLPELDSTQTIRALTSDELQDQSQEKWFAIQVAVSDQPVNLDAMPRLDIFEAYRLYSVATAGSGKITHSLRIGFFREEVSAEAVCGYLKTFFNSPSVVRISIAEHARFRDAPKPKAAPKAEVLDLSHARDRAAKPVPTVTVEVDTPRFDPGATGTFKTSATGMHKALSATGVHRALGAAGADNALKTASKSAPAATKRSAPMSKTSSSGKYKGLQPKKSLAEELLEEARQVELSESAIRKLPKNDSLLSKMFGKLTKS